MQRNNYLRKRVLPIRSLSPKREFAPDEAFELMNLQTAIDILEDLAQLTNDLDEWFRQYKYVERYADRPELPRFKGTFVELLTKLLHTKEDRHMIAHYFEKALKDYEDKKNIINIKVQAS